MMGYEGLTSLSQPFLATLPFTGASITVISQSGTPVILSSSDAIATRIDELHFELGEGPQWSAARSGEWVAIEDAASDGHSAWPVFGAELRQLPVASLYCAPLTMGAVTVGVATLYSSTIVRLTSDQRRTALAIGSALAGAAVHQALSKATDQSLDDDNTPPALHRAVHQATGMLIVQLDTTATLAYARLQAYAFAQGRNIVSVAHDVVTGVISFDADLA